MPWGIFGGKQGAVGRVVLSNIHTGENTEQPSKFSGLQTQAGDVISYYSPCGGGYGDPLERDPEKVLDDVLDEIITLEDARDDYGVVFAPVDDGYGWAVDLAATEKLREQMA